MAGSTNRREKTTTGKGKIRGNAIRPTNPRTKQNERYDGRQFPTNKKQYLELSCEHKQAVGSGEEREGTGRKISKATIPEG